MAFGGGLGKGEPSDYETRGSRVSSTAAHGQSGAQKARLHDSTGVHRRRRPQRCQGTTDVRHSNGLGCLVFAWANIIDLGVSGRFSNGRHGVCSRSRRSLLAGDRSAPDRLLSRAPIGQCAVHPRKTRPKGEAAAARPRRNRGRVHREGISCLVLAWRALVTSCRRRLTAACSGLTSASSRRRGGAAEAERWADKACVPRL